MIWRRRSKGVTKLDDVVVWLVMLFAALAGACGASVLWAIFIAWRKGVGA